MTVKPRHIILCVILIVVAALNLQQWRLWENTVPRYNLDGSPVPDSGADMLAVFLKNPLGLIASPGWGDKGQYVFATIFASLAMVALLWVLQGGRTKSTLLGSYTVKMHALQNHLHGYKPIDCRLQTLVWILTSVPAALIFIACGATLNYFWDFTNNTFYAPWHFCAHFLLAYSIVSVWACFDIEGVLGCAYRWKAIILLGALNILSLYLENTENLMILQYGLHPWMYNSIADSRFDICAVLLGGLIALVAYNACQYGD